MPLFGSSPADAQTWAPQAADSRLAHPAMTTPKPAFTLGLDS